MVHELYIIQVDKNDYGSISYRNKLSNKFHRNALNEKESNLLSCDENSFKFNDGSIVTIGSRNICCNHVCRLCGICQHSYWCSCYNYSIKTLICKHIHSVAYREGSKIFNTQIQE